MGQKQYEIPVSGKNVQGLQSAQPIPTAQQVSNISNVPTMQPTTTGVQASPMLQQHASHTNYFGKPRRRVWSWLLYIGSVLLAFTASPLWIALTIFLVILDTIRAISAIWRKHKYQTHGVTSYSVNPVAVQHNPTPQSAVNHSYEIISGYRRMRSFPIHFFATIGVGMSCIVNPFALPAFVGLFLLLFCRSRLTHYTVKSDGILLTQGFLPRTRVYIKPEQISDIWLVRSNLFYYLTGDAKVMIRDKTTDPLTGSRTGNGVLEIVGLGNFKKMVRIHDEIGNAVYKVKGNP